MARKRKTKATNTAPSPKRTTRATSRADKGTSRGSVENDETTEANRKKLAEQVSLRAKNLCCMNPFFMRNLYLCHSSSVLVRKNIFQLSILLESF